MEPPEAYEDSPLILRTWVRERVSGQAAPCSAAQATAPGLRGCGRKWRACSSCMMRPGSARLPARVATGDIHAGQCSIGADERQASSSIIRRQANILRRNLSLSVPLPGSHCLTVRGYGTLHLMQYCVIAPPHCLAS